ncbi:hypothetical protein AHMF7605_11585 [Adhaeribacter arboris]|uniref:Uncharacterized protein n=1 Tax=Adhaeribacter arboris TaxID=2072846 RepID=A0A2T2YF55_9BACT|nr:hypothetical protein [Adhaeribacter arboris]PSR54113.1 hypothetical protein AHMF7605_11585 [Adhaeribacter arboris]
MTRNYFINHLIEQECYPDEECNSEISQLWHNAISGDVCYVPLDEELEIPTWCHIIFELGVNPPIEFDSDYHVYCTFREDHLKQVVINKNRQ